MRIMSDPDFGTTSKSLVIEHKGQRIVMGIKRYMRPPNIEKNFRPLNDFWAWRPEEEQDQIFQCYKNIEDALNTFAERNTRYVLRNREVLTLLKFHDIELMKIWFIKRSGISLPPDLKKEYAEEDKPEQTYLEPDYIGLCALSIIIRCMMPIWSEYMERGMDISGTLLHRWALALIKGSELENTEEFQRFKQFITFLVGDAKLGMDTILNTELTNASLPEELFATALVDKLPVLPFAWDDDPLDDKKISNLAAQLYRFVEGRSNNLGDNSMSKVVNKSLSGKKNAKGEEDSTSVAEQYKSVQNISEVNMMTFDAYLKHYDRWITQFDLDLDLFEQILSFNTKRPTFNPFEFQRKLMGVVTSSVLEPRTIPYCNRTGLNVIMSLAQTLALKHNFMTIASIIGDTVTAKRNRLATRSSVSKSVEYRLNELYKITRNVKAGNSATRPSPKNPALVSIDAYFADASCSYWGGYEPDFLDLDLAYKRDDLGLYVPNTFKDEMGEMIIKVVKKTI